MSADNPIFISILTSDDKISFPVRQAAEQAVLTSAVIKERQTL